jgi:hypothetical protein
MKYKPGDKVRIKSIDWYNENKDENCRVLCSYIGFCKEMTKYCGEVLTIMTIGNQDIGSKQKYFMHETDYAWGFTDDMIEGLADVEEAQEKMVSLNEVCKFLDEHLYTGTSTGDYDFGQEYIYSDFDNASDLIFALRKAMEE